MELLHRPRRLRENPVLRKMVRETRVDRSALIYPVFVCEGRGVEQPIKTLPGQQRWSADRLLFRVERLLQAGVNSLMLFGIPEQKDDVGSSAWAEDGVVQKALQLLKREFPELYCITDVCMCEYTSHGHCGVLTGCSVDNDKTLPLLAKTALSHVQAGADLVAPSDMMDGRIGAIRHLLDQNGFYQVPIMSYAVKYASAFYGPFREAANSAPSFGDRKGYQMDYHNRREAMIEAELDLSEGADILMVKPAMAYLDIICEISNRSLAPTAAYSVSGEYAMIKAAAEKGWIEEAAVVCESAVSIFRAGADILITYYAEELAGWITEGRIG